MTSLPIDAYLPDIRVALDRARAVVVTAQPGTGKTTRVPPALVDRGPAILLQPRRVAARSVAARIASERGWTLGADVGWHVRFDRRSSPHTRLLVVTEGILTARLQSDPLLSDFLTIVLDEFHERSIHADLALALAKQAWRARSDLRLVVMSATLDVAPVTRFLEDCPVVHVPGQMYPVETTYEPGAVASEVACRLAARRQGDVLCFMPGAAEIRRTVGEIDARRLAAPRDVGGVEVLPLHGAMDGAEQDRALVPHDTGITRIIVATNIAETSLTVPGVRSVVDAGLQKVARYDAARGIDSLATERITQDSADQRSGRAGRVGSGCVVRLWDARDRLKSHREPDIHRIDLATLALDVLAWGGRPSHFEWFESPRSDRLAAALELLARLGAARDEQLTDRGRLMQKLPLHPRLASMLIEGQGHPMLVRACALLSERLYLPPRRHTTTSDLLSALDQWDAAPAHVIQAAHDICVLRAMLNVDSD